MFDEVIDLIAELGFVDDIQDVGRESVEIGDEIMFERLFGFVGLEVAEKERRTIAKSLICGSAKGFVLFLETNCIELGFHGEHGLFCGLQNRVKTTNDSYGQNDFR